jgi:uncharacterized protein YkwD
MTNMVRSALFGLFVGLAAATGVQACSTPSQAAALEAGMFEWINQVRAERGLQPYKRSGHLDRSAEYQACDMARYDYFAHSRPGGPKLGSRMKSAGYRVKAGSENLAYTQQLKVASAATVWRNSPPHWANIMDRSMRDIGISVVTDGGKVLWVMNVGRPKG